MTTFRMGSLGTAALCLLLAAGCDRDEATTAAGDGPVERGGVAVLAEGADINSPMTIISNSALDGNLSGDVMNMHLLRTTWEDGRLIWMTADQSPMSLAKTYEYLAPDSTALRFHMRSDAKWSDGQPVTARDVAFTYRMLREPALASSQTEYTSNMDSVVAHNDTTVTFYFGHRYSEMLFHTGATPIPEHIYRNVPAAELRNHETILNPAGKLVVSGPFMVGAWVQADRVVLVPNPHFRPAPHLDQIVIRIIPEALTRLVELQTGNVDFVQNVAFDQIPALRAQPNIRLERQHKRFYDYVVYNPESHPAFADPEIRRAFAMALDIPRLISALQGDEFAVPGSGPYAPIFADLYDEQLTPPIPFDLEGAKRILESKGWVDSNGDGIREKAGRPLSFSLVTNVGNTRRADASQVIQQQWKQLGVDAQLRTLEFNTLIANLNEGNYEAVLSGWSVQLGADLSTLFGEDSPFNYGKYRNPQVTSLFEQALAQPTPETAAPFWKQAAAQIARDQPYTWLYYLDGVAAVNNRLRNTNVNTYGPYNNAWEWWIPVSERRPGGAAPAANADSTP